MAIGHINVRHQQDEADKVEDVDDVVEVEETEVEEDEDRMAGWPCWCRRNQQL